jgi:hypothetical protein
VREVKVVIRMSVPDLMSDKKVKVGLQDMLTEWDDVEVSSVDVIEDNEFDSADEDGD